MRSASKEVAVAQRLDCHESLDRLSGYLGDLKLDGSTGLKLNDDCAIAHDESGADILDFEPDQV